MSRATFIVSRIGNYRSRFAPACHIDCTVGRRITVARRKAVEELGWDSATAATAAVYRRVRS